MNKFVNPLEADERISLSTKDARRFITEIERVSRRFGYDFMLSNVPALRIATPGPNPGDPVVITYGGHINLLEHFSSENVRTARKFASLTWGDGSFTESVNQVLEPLTVARGEVTNHVPPRLTQLGRNRMRDRTQSSNMGYQALALLSNAARTSIELHKKEYTWTSADRRDVEYDGATIVTLILSRLKPHYKVDLFAEISECKAMKLSDFKNVVPDYFDALQNKKIAIDQKSTTAYTEDAYIRDILTELCNCPVEIFAKEWKSTSNRWLMGKEHLVSTTVVDEATLMYVNLLNSNQWKVDHSASDQIIALTSQLKVLESKLEAKTSSAQPATNAGRGQSGFEMWRLTKVENNEEHNKVFRNGRTYYWCNDGHSFDGTKCGMYVYHKPGAEHVAWQKKKTENQQRKNERRAKYEKDRSAGDDQKSTPPHPAAAGTAADASTKKLSLSQHLKSALVTHAGLSDDQFQTIWEDACNQSGN